MADYDPFFPVFSPHHTGTSKNAGLQKMSTDPSKWTLYEAVSRNRLDVVQRILSLPASYDFQEIAGALRLAGTRGYIEIGRFLLSRTHIQVDVHCPDGYTPLILAARQGHDEMVQMLIENGADPSRAIYRTKVSALHWAAVNGHVQCVDVLLKAGAPPNPLTLQHRTPLLLAACYGHIEVVKRLLRSADASDISHADANGMTALHMSVMEGHAVCADLLLSQSANIDAQNHQGYTPLLMAIERDHQEIAFRLIRSDANLELQLYGCCCRAIHLGIALERNDICGYLLDANCSLASTCELVQSCCGSIILHGDITTLHILATGRDIVTMTKILDKVEESHELTADFIFASTSDGHSCLMLGAAYGSPLLLTELVKNHKKFVDSPPDKNRFLAEISLAVTCACLRGRTTALLSLLQITGSNLPKPRVQLNNYNNNVEIEPNSSRLTAEMINELCPEGRLCEGTLGILTAAGNCDEILRVLVDLLPDDATVAECVSNRFAYPNRLEQLCVATIRQSLGPIFDGERVFNSLELPPSLLRSITLSDPTKS